MARYIDADAFKRELIIEASLIHAKKRKKLDFPSLVARVLDEMPTADVVPKSEVGELKAIIADHKASEERLEELYSNAKADVAREIFEEIESKKIFLKYHTGKISVVVTLKDIAELKKKYTEDQT